MLSFIIGVLEHHLSLGVNAEDLHDIILELIEGRVAKHREPPDVLIESSLNLAHGCYFHIHCLVG